MLYLKNESKKVVILTTSQEIYKFQGLEAKKIEPKGLKHKQEVEEIGDALGLTFLDKDEFEEYVNLTKEVEELIPENIKEVFKASENLVNTSEENITPDNKDLQVLVDAGLVKVETSEATVSIENTGDITIETESTIEVVSTETPQEKVEDNTETPQEKVEETPKGEDQGKGKQAKGKNK